MCLDIIKKFKELGNEDLGLRVFFFDEEETGLKGSTAYIKERGTKDLMGLMNMELVGLGDQFALWPIDHEINGLILKTFEATSHQKKIPSKRFNQIATNTTDHLPFQKAGLKDSFTITCISDRDIETAQHYFKALEIKAYRETLVEILSKAPIFEHYHRPTDTFEKLNEDSIAITSATIWDILLAIQNTRSRI